MSKHETFEEFDVYLKKLLEKLHLDQDEKMELEEEWKQHLMDHYQALLQQQMDREAAIQAAIEQFGEIAMLQNEINQTYPNAKKNHLINTAIIACICLIASILGPIILIGARPYFPIAAVMMAYVIHSFIINKQKNVVFSLFCILASYICFWQLAAQIKQESFNFEFVLNQLFSLEWSRLTGSNGLFEIVTIHMMWYVLLLVQLLSSKRYQPLGKRITQASFQYWAMIIVGIFLARLQSSAEIGVIFLNIFMLYGFLQQIISVQFLSIWKEKVFRLVNYRVRN
ncbi:permease prefix domain 1-containing protein [Bacillus oleivorans]|uniref:permease prefix domain 1-containing protein n=1 Tax=Bacillus oleivorans TaxID=1448271 RepID=UPI000BE23AAB|nr:permease prefix domain 1-containing protein [Bacillus oleivorans]